MGLHHRPLSAKPAPAYSSLSWRSLYRESIPHFFRLVNRFSDFFRKIQSRKGREALPERWGSKVVRLCRGREGREALPHTPLRKLFGEKFPKDLQKLLTSGVVVQSCRKCGFRKKSCCRVESGHSGRLRRQPASGLPLPLSLSSTGYMWFRDAGMQGCGERKLRACALSGSGSDTAHVKKHTYF